MQKINQLSKHMANLIAAGEVVERPASVVKELLENAIDAGATVITVEIRNGGVTYISVTDNGCGIFREDVETAFLRHATSKIRCADDLASIETFGFRGEALAAIAAVSRVSMQTRTAEESIGTHIVLDGGAVMDLTDAGGPVGTSIAVSDLFYNTPARHKFLKKDSTEAAYVQTVCQRTAMAHPDISIKLLKDGAVELHTPGDGSLHTALYCMFGREAVQGLSEVDFSRPPISVQGYVSKPTWMRASRSMQYFFVNDRPVKNMTVQAALEEAFRGKSVGGKFPCAVLNIHLPADMVDVNVHPAKTEVKFSVEKKVFEAVYYGVLATFEPSAPVSPIPAEPASNPVPPAPRQTVLPQTFVSSEDRDSVYKKHMNSTIQHAIIREADSVPMPSTAVLCDVFSSPPVSAHNADASGISEKSGSVLPKFTSVLAPQAMDIPSVEPVPVTAEPTEDALRCPPVEEPVAPAYRILGELFGVYILIEQADELLILDKHAAHERIRYNDLLVHHQKIASQTLLDAPVVALDPEEKALLLSHADELLQTGFELEDFGGSSVIVRAVPSVYEPSEVAAAISEIARNLSARGITVDEKRDRLFKMVACKSAIRSGDHSNPEELRHLTERVLSDESVRFCPHGRPVLTVISKKELEKRFQRIV